MYNKSYFTKLNYTFCNEDTTLEYEILQENTNHVLSIAGSGSRVLPLLARKPHFLTCVDTSQEQLYITELRIESLRALKYREFLAFWGYPTKNLTPFERKKIFKTINLSGNTKKHVSELFEKNKWHSILYIGRWEKTIGILSTINRFVTGERGRTLFLQKNEKSYFLYLRDHFPHKAWKLIVSILGNATVLNTLLYRGSFLRKNIHKSYSQFYLDSLNTLFHQGPARNNFILQLLFFGRLVYPEGNPIECNEEIFLKAKEGIRDAKISYACKDIVLAIKSSSTPIDFLSFSDVPSYLKGETECTYLRQIAKNLMPGCVVMMRYYLRIPENVDESGYEDITTKYAKLIKKEKTQVYKIKVLRKV